MTVTKTKDLVTSSLQRIQKQIQALPQQAFATWVANTPVRSGNARRKTRLQGTEIQANYNYAVPLDQGSSKQSPDGMSRPTELFLERQLKKIIRK
jgi:hypothetical protein